MAESNHNSGIMPKDVEQNAEARAVEIDKNPALALEQARNAAEGKMPNAVRESIAPSTAEEHIFSTSDPKATDLSTANAPDRSKQ